MAAKKGMVHRRQFLKICSLKFCDIWQNFYFYRTFNNKNFKMEVQQTNFVTHFFVFFVLFCFISHIQTITIHYIYNSLQVTVIVYKKEINKKKRKDKVHQNTIVYILTIKRRLPLCLMVLHHPSARLSLVL